MGWRIAGAVLKVVSNLAWLASLLGAGALLDAWWQAGHMYLNVGLFAVALISGAVGLVTQAAAWWIRWRPEEPDGPPATGRPALSSTPRVS